MWILGYVVQRDVGERAHGPTRNGVTAAATAVLQSPQRSTVGQGRADRSLANQSRSVGGLVLGQLGLTVAMILQDHRGLEYSVSLVALYRFGGQDRCRSL